MEISNRPAVRYIMSLEIPLSTKNVTDQRRATAAGLAVCSVIGAHNGFHAGFLHAGFKSGQIGFIHILFACFGIKFVTHALRPGMYCKMLCAGRCFHIFVILAALQSLHIGNAKT